MQLLIYFVAFVLIALWRMRFTVLRKSNHQYLRLNGFKAFELWLINNHVCRHREYTYYTNHNGVRFRMCKRCATTRVWDGKGWLSFSGLKNTLKHD